MTKFEIALEDALAQLQAGESAEQAAARHPQHAEQLLPLLQAAQRMQQAEPAGARPEFPQRGRAALIAHMQAHPRARVTTRLPRGLRYATALAALALAFATATMAMAQSALPGQALYPLKLASEKVWRAVHFNPIYVDLELSDRRLDELLAVQNDSARATTALAAYATSLDQLERDLTAAPTKALSARDVITSQKEQVRAVLEASGSSADEFFSIIPSLDELIQKNPNQVPVVVPSLQVPIVIPVLPSLGSSRNELGQEDASGQESSKDEGGQSILSPAEGLLDTAKDAVDDLLQGLP